MDSVKEKVIYAIADRCGIDESEISDDANIISDLGIDSVDFLDVTYDLDKAFNITIPIESWMESVNSGDATLDDYFVFENFVGLIAKLANKTKILETEQVEA
jgi:acyl carrier protein